MNHGCGWFTDGTLSARVPDLGYATPGQETRRCLTSSRSANAFYKQLTKLTHLVNLSLSLPVLPHVVHPLDPVKLSANRCRGEALEV